MALQVRRDLVSEGLAVIVLGVDAALNKSGLAICLDDVIVWSGICQMPARFPTPAKLGALYMEVGLALDADGRKAIGPLIVVVERPGSWARGSPRSTQGTVEALAQARAAVHLAAVNRGRRSLEIDVNEARRLVLGQVSGGPGRRLTKELVRHLLEQRGVDPELIKDPDAADAAVIALAGWSLWKVGEYD